MLGKYTRENDRREADAQGVRLSVFFSISYFFFFLKFRESLPAHVERQSSCREISNFRLYTFFILFVFMYFTF